MTKSYKYEKFEVDESDLDPTTSINSQFLDDT